MNKEKPTVIQIVDGLKITNHMAEKSNQLMDNRIGSDQFINDIGELEDKITEGWFDLTEQDLNELGWFRCLPSTLDSFIPKQKIQELKKRFIEHFKVKPSPKCSQETFAFNEGFNIACDWIIKELEKLLEEGDEK